MDVRDTYARCHVLPALQQGGADLLPALETSAAPLIGRTLAEIARIEQAAAVAHAGSAQDHIGIAAAVRDIDPALDVVAVPASARERADVAPGTSASPASHYAVAGALWGRSLRPVGETAAAPPESLFAVSRRSWRGEEIAATLDVAFESGVPVAVNDIPMPLPELIESVATIAGHHAVGRIVDSGSSTVYEAPAAVVLAEAHRALMSTPNAQGSGTIRLRLCDGECLVLDDAAPAPSPHVSALAGHAS
jgi:argininosuccinate synthase